MIEGRTIICIASNWAFDPTSKHHVMRILSERNHVIWVNYHGSRRPRLGLTDARGAVAKLRQVVEGPRRVSPSMMVVTPLVAPIPGSRAAAALNRRLLVRQIRAILRKLPARPVQLWSFAPDVHFLCGAFDEECVVYYCVDEFSAFTGYDRDAVQAAERDLARRADLVVTTSSALFDAKRRLNPNSILVTHGVDYEAFAGAGHVIAVGAAGEIARPARPVLGFWGLIQDWVDIPLLAAVARARPEWSILMIGEIATEVSLLRARPNVRLLGRRDYADLPGLARRLDLGLIPFRVNELTRAVNPIKLREYLSAGLPVVSTGLPEARRYGDLVRVVDCAEGAAGAEAFAAACEAELAADSPARAAARRSAMAGETWRVKVEELSRAVMASRRPQPGGIQSAQAIG